MTEFSKFYKKNFKIDMGYKMSKLGDGEYLVQCNHGVPKEPYKIFQMLKFREIFKSKERKSFNISIALVGKMNRPESWES